MFEDKIVYRELSYKIVGLAMQVHTELGYGFLEKVYENSLLILLREHGIEAKQQFPINVIFHNQIVGEYFADILVEDKIILELKSQPDIAEIHKAQTLHYLKATGHKLALLLNFGKQKLEHDRFIF